VVWGGCCGIVVSEYLLLKGLVISASVLGTEIVEVVVLEGCLVIEFLWEEGSFCLGVMGSWDMGELSANFVGRIKEVEAVFFLIFPVPFQKSSFPAPPS
jgi:hypothetical protein